MDEQKYNLDQSLAELNKLLNLSAKATDKASREALAEKARIIYEQYPKSEDIALQYARILVNLSTNQTVLKERMATAKKLEKLQKKFQDSYDIAEALAMILFNLSIEQTDLKELETTAEKLQVLQQQFQDSHDIAKALAMILFNLSIEQTDLKELETTAEKLQVLQQQFQDSHDIAEALAKILFNLSIEQTDLKELEATAEKLQVLQQQFPDSPDVVLEYAKILVNLSTKQTELKELEASVSKLQSLQERFDKSEIIAFIYGVFLANLFDLQTKVDEYAEETEKIKKLYKQFSKFMLQIFDDLFFRDDNVCDRKEYKLFNFILKEDLLKNTKYAILQTWAERYKEDSSELKNLLSIYQLVQKIKYQLGLKDKDKNQVLKFGHYTKGNTLQIMLDQEENEKKKSIFSVSGKTRLYNANYMNDPEEGIVIEQILSLDRRDVLEPSSWFLMSFTNKTDDLAMWSQYGDDAKGFCLVLREDDFSRFTSFNDVSWRKESIPLVETMNKIESTLAYDLKGSPNELNNIKPTVAIENEEKRSKSEKKRMYQKGIVIIFTELPMLKI